MFLVDPIYLQRIKAICCIHQGEQNWCKENFIIIGRIREVQ